MSRDIAMRLLSAGADPGELTYEGQRIVLGLPPIDEDALSGVSLDDFKRAFSRIFGKGNPDRMNIPFWNVMIRCGAQAYAARSRFNQARIPLSTGIWCAQRFGQSLTLLPDGRAIQIAGEHEDHYDPDFCIYNDVFVHERDGSVVIYGYPESVFPPTDFHTATLVGNFIYIIGSLGHPEDRCYGETPVFRLNTQTLRMERLVTTGQAPGWIYRHRAVALSLNEIHVWRGKVVTFSDGKESHEANLRSFVLDLDRLAWRDQ